MLLRKHMTALTTQLAVFDATLVCSDGRMERQKHEVGKQINGRMVFGCCVCVCVCVCVRACMCVDFSHS